MKKIYKKLTSVIAAMTIAFASVPVNMCAVDYTYSASALETAESELAGLINSARKEKGLGELKVNSYLCDVADIRAEELTENFSHIRPNGEYYTTLIDSSKFNFEKINENLCKGYETPEEALNAWKAAESHWKVIIDEEATDMGIGFYKDSKGTVCWALLIGNPIEEDKNNEDININKAKSELAELINNARKENGLGELEFNSYLGKCADMRAEELSESFGHVRPNGEYYTTIIDESKLSYENISEIATMGQKSADELLEALKESKPHWKNIIDEKATTIGIGIYKDSEDNLYWDLLICDVTESDNNNDEKKSGILDLINKERKENGFAELKLNPYLCKCADIRAEELTENPAHIRPNGENFVTVIDTSQLDYDIMNEIIGMTGSTFGTPEKIIDIWKENETEWRKIMDIDAFQMGIGLYEDSEDNLYCILLIESSDVFKNPEKSKNKLADLINNARKEEGLPELKLNTYLCECADIRSQELTENFNHIRPNGENFASVIDESKFPFEIVYENLGMGFAIPESILDAWKQSDVQWKNIIDENSTDMGIGIYKDSENNLYWTLLIANQIKDSEEIIYGDINFDRKVDVYDYMIIMQFLNDSEKYNLSDEQLMAADCFQDGLITVSDAKCIMKYVLGETKALPVSIDF